MIFARLKLWVAGLAAAVVAVLVALAGARRKGRKEALLDMEKADEKRANEVRRRIDAARGVSNEDIRFRD